MMNTGTITRRRALQIAAGMGVSCLMGTPSAKQLASHTWRGTALGGEACIEIHSDNRQRDEKLILQCVTEIRRLEQIFSLFQADSALSQLNRYGILGEPPQELVQLLTQARYLGNITMGAFDITVQPLWAVYKRHFSKPGADPDGPSSDDIQRALELVDYKAVNVNNYRLVLERPGMGVTLNGIAQGYITDRVSDMLRESGLTNVLIDLGEFRAIGRHSDDRAWRIGIRDPKASTEQLAATLPLENGALATSGGYGTQFDANGKHHHLFDPRSGLSTNRYLDITVTAPTATMADALSTGFSNMELRQIAAITSELGDVSVRATLPDKSVWLV